MMMDKEAEANQSPCSADFRLITAKDSDLKITHKYTLGDISSPTFTCRFDWNDKYIAAGKGDGRIEIYNVFTGKCSYTLNEGMEEPMPTTNIR